MSDKTYDAQETPMPLQKAVLGWSEGTPREPHRKGWMVVCPIIENCQHITHWCYLPNPPRRNCGNCNRCLAGDVMTVATRMIVCPDCGDKRCAKADDCKNECEGAHE